MCAGIDRQVALISREHDWMLERLHSLDNCLDNICYYGEVCGDVRGFGGLQRRCRELQHALVQHIPDEEEIFARLSDDPDLKGLLEDLRAEHQVIAGVLSEMVTLLGEAEAGAPLREDLIVLQDKLRRFSNFMQRHIAVENLHVFRRPVA